ncbi:hypothetical protein WICPIJ_009788 [Wickerhamomyces pijperi]|uniref:ATP-dependent (S)-NAD(P)H-hydrate dehydratase n=1 Tax=Wickerhamomyces pijperi TaxID=599730 RepID=A0A9P8TCF6_WICPI|nr:hypothetical protein WICPIJ_009788 [Wickerhamomyces pijperi]
MTLAKASQSELLQLVREIVPPLLPSLHKGQGCEDYTGAPYFSSHAALLFGCDLSHVICEHRAATVIKSYTPDLMVHPYLYDTGSLAISSNNNRDELKQMALEKSKSVLSRSIHCVVLGPGLGRDELMSETVTELIQFLKHQGTPMILDADALFIITKNPELIKGYKNCILTPNVMEFKRLAVALGIELSESTSDVEALKKETVQLSKALGGLAVLRKGAVDIMVQGDKVLLNSMEGSNRRVGGQGDTLTGVLATLTAWSRAYKDNVWKHGQVITNEEDLRLLASFGASSVARTASRLAFKENGRAMQTSDVQKAVGKAYKVIIEEKEL